MSESEGSVLVVDDDPIVRDVLSRYLAKEGFGVTAAADGEAALDAVSRNSPDLVVLDLMLPRMDGFEVFRRLRAAGGGPAVIMLTALGETTDRVVGLEAGADDYVAKPFSPREMVARCRAIIRRTRAPDATREVLELAEPIDLGELYIDPASREVTLSGSPIALTPKEFDLLVFFARQPRIAFTRLQLLEELWDVAYAGDPSTVTVHIRRLREKIEPDPSSPKRLVTVWGAGYRFDP
jgi:DNA-binding response OmpR family regulator